MRRTCRAGNPEAQPGRGHHVGRSRSGVAVATLYNQFGSREGVIGAALQADFQGRFEPLSKRTKDLSPAEQLDTRITTATKAILGDLREYTRSVMFFYFHHTPHPALRGAMYEETLRFFTDFFQNGRSILSLLDADHTFVNGALAKHYGLSVTNENWQRVEGIKATGRGGVLGHSTVLAKQSGASRTSPILRGNWISEVLLGEKLPRPPKDVPQLPDDEANLGLTMRELVEKHTKDPRCMSCHRRVDPFGFALERFDAIGRARDRDLGGRPIHTATKVMDGTELDGLDGLRRYLLGPRRDAFVRQFCRKLLGYALGRAVQLSDEPLLDEMLAALPKQGYSVNTAIDLIVSSRQFREIRGQQQQQQEEPAAP